MRKKLVLLGTLIFFIGFLVFVGSQGQKPNPVITISGIVTDIEYDFNYISPSYCHNTIYFQDGRVITLITTPYSNQIEVNLESHYTFEWQERLGDKRLIKYYLMD